MTTYPHVFSEQETLGMVLGGMSLARFGDGEINLGAGRAAKRQVADPRLQLRLREILLDSGDCLVGLPHVQADSPKVAFWRKYLLDGVAEWLSDRPYGSAFISRPDSAPWINTAAYWQALETLWIDQDVTLVTGGTHGLTTADLVGARSVREITGPARNAFADYDDLLDRIGRPSRVLLCLGPTATVLAVDLCARGVHAVDLGHCAMFLRKHRRGDPMVVTAADKAVA